MKAKILIGSLIVPVFMTGGLFASELMSGADLWEAKSVGFSVYGGHTESKANLDSAWRSNLSNPNSEVELDLSYTAALAALQVRPHDGLTYRFKAGLVEHFELKYSSGSQTNTFDSQDGFVWGVGGRWNMSQATMVSPAVALDVSYEELRAQLDHFEGGPAVFVVNDEYRESEMQAAINVSKKFKWFEPYGGLKVQYRVSSLKDKTTTERMSGRSQSVVPFVGASLEMFEKENLVVEASFLDEKAIFAGLNIQF